MAIEPIEWKNAKGKPLNPKPQDPGATRMIFHVTDIDKLTGYLKQGSAKALTAGGAPVEVAGPAGMSRSIVFDDGNGFFVELVQPDKLLEQLGGPASNALRSFCLRSRHHRELSVNTAPCVEGNAGTRPRTTDLDTRLKSMR